MSDLARADVRGWGRGWPTCDAMHSGQVVVVIAGANRCRFPVHRLIAPLVAEKVRRLEAARGFPLNPAWCWGASCRPIAGTSTPSNHSWALATDDDAPTNPRRRPLTTNFPLAATRAIAASLMFRWGADYRTAPPDPMHFEFAGTPADAIRLAAALGHAPPAGHPLLEDDEMAPRLVPHPVAGFTLILAAGGPNEMGAVHNHPDNRGGAPRYLGGMNTPKYQKARRHAPKMAPVGGYYVRDGLEKRTGKAKGTGWALVICYPDGAAYQFPSDASEAGK